MTIISLFHYCRSWLVIFVAALALGACGDGAKSQSDHAQEVAGEHGKTSEEFERGPHRGRMLRTGDFAVEVTIFEDGVKPEFHVYAFSNHKPLAPAQLQLTMKVTRLGGKVDAFTFAPKDDFLLANASVHEPHSFDVEVAATYGGKPYRWTYSSYEGRTTIDPQAAEQGGVKTEAAGPATIDEMIDLPGRIVLQPQGRAEIRAWYPGRITEMTKSIGQTVTQGDVLVRIEASDSLRNYQITAPISGIVVERNANVGDVATQAIYVINDITQLQASFFAFPRDAERLKQGQEAEIRGLGGQQANTTIKMVLPSADPATQTVSIFGDLPNGSGAWRPGMAIEGIIKVASTKVPLAVRTRALQRFRDFTVVFAKVENTYEVRMLKLGRQTPEWTEVLEGIEPGDVYVSDNAFLIRADVEKSGASHDH